MAKGRNIKGITLEIGGDTTSLEKALKNVNSKVKDTESQLKDVQRLLKLDPKNTELLAQKQKLLGEEIKATKDKLSTLKTAAEQANEALAKGEITQEQYDALQREIIATEQALGKLETQAEKSSKAFHGEELENALKKVDSELGTTQEQLKKVDELLKLDPTNTELIAQKERLLGDAVSETKTKLETLKTAAEQANEALEKGDITQQQYDAIQREIVETENELKNLEKAAEQSNAKMQEIAGIGTKLSETGSKVASAGESFLPVTAAVAGLGAAAVKTTADFEQSMAQVKATSGASADEMEKLGEKAEEMGAKTKFSASEAGDAFNYMAMAGWDSTKMLGGIEGVMNLAAASGEDLATTSDIVTDAMTALQIEVDESGKNVNDFADVLAMAARSANTDVGMMGESFKYVAPVAGALGYESRDLASALGLMANGSVKASQAGTQLRAGLSNMTGPSKAVAEAMDSLGFYAKEAVTSFDTEAIDKQSLKTQEMALAVDKASDAYNSAVAKYGEGSSQATRALTKLDITTEKYNQAQEKLAALQSGTTKEVSTYNKAIENEDGSVKSLKETMDFLRETMGGLSKSEQTAAASAIFGKTAMAGWLNIINASDKDYEKLISNMDNCAGTAKEMADTQLDTLEGQLTILKSSLDGLAIGFGKILLPTIKQIATHAQGLLDKLNGLSEGQKRVITVIALILAAVGPLLITVGKTLVLVGQVMTYAPKIKAALSIFPKIIAGIKGALSGLFSLIAAHPIIAAIVAVIAIVVLLYKKCEWFRNAVNAIWTAIKTGFFAAWDGIKTFFTETLPNAWNSVVSWVQGIPAWWQGIWQSVGEFFTNIWTGMMKNPVLSTIAETLGNIWQNAVNTIQGIWDGLKQIASGVWEMIKNIVLGPVLLLCDLVTGNFEQLKSDAQNIWNNIKNAALTIWNGIKTTIGSIVTGLVNHVQIVLNGFVSILIAIWNSIKTTAINTWSNLKTQILNLANNIKTGAVNGFKSMVSGIRNTVSKIGGIIKNGFQSAIEFITGLPGRAYEWGRDFIQGIINGITSMISKVTDAVSNVAETIRSFLHFSVPDEGPLTDYESWMPDFMKGLAQGINQNKSLVENAIQGLAQGMRLDTAGNTSNTVNMGGVAVNVYAKDGQSARAIAEEVETIINSKMTRAKAAFA